MQYRYITSENLFTKTLTSCLKIDPSTVFSAFDMDKLGKSAPLERAPKKIHFLGRLDTARKASWGELSYRAPLEQGSIFIFLSESSAGQVILVAYLPGYNLLCPEKVQDYKKNAALHKHIVLGNMQFCLFWKLFYRTRKAFYPLI